MKKLLWKGARANGAGVDRVELAVDPARFPAATDDDLQLINALPEVQKPLTADDVIVFSANVANTKPFKDGVRQFSVRALKQMAGMAAGLPMLVNHDSFSSTSLNIGRWFAGRYAELADGPWFQARGYMVNDAPNQVIAGRILAGAISEVSLSAYLPVEDYLCSICKAPYSECDHIAGDDYGPEGTAGLIMDQVEEMDEISLVWAGMVDGTSIRVAAEKSREGVLTVEQFDAAMREAPTLEEFLWRPPAANLEEFLKTNC